MSGFHLGAALAGLVFAVAGALFLLEELDLIVLQTGLIAPRLLIALGGAAMIGTLARRDGS